MTRAEYRIVESYEPDRVESAGCPVIVLKGDQDELVTVAGAWRTHCAAGM